MSSSGHAVLSLLLLALLAGAEQTDKTASQIKFACSVDAVDDVQGLLASPSSRFRH